MLSFSRSFQRHKEKKPTSSRSKSNSSSLVPQISVTNSDESSTSVEGKLRKEKVLLSASADVDPRFTKKMLSKRMASDTDLWLSLAKHQERYSRMVEVARAANLDNNAKRSSSVTTDSAENNNGSKIFINRVSMPPATAGLDEKADNNSGQPTPVNKRVLDQEEFNRKLKAKRAIFSKSRSLSLASFRMSVPKIKTPKLVTAADLGLLTSTANNQGASEAEKVCIVNTCLARRLING